MTKLRTHSNLRNPSKGIRVAAFPREVQTFVLLMDGRGRPKKRSHSYSRTHSLSPSPPPPSSSSVELRYVKDIGAGGMGRVQLFEKDLFHVVKKTVLDARNPRQRARLTREVAALRKLQHQYIVPLLWEEKDGYFMPYYPLGSLATLFTRREPPTAEEVFKITRHVVEALSYAANNDFIHHDINPSNILLEWRLHPRVIDWGLVYEAADSHSTVEAGTGEYKAPELHDGARPSEVTDIYSLGVTLKKFVAAARDEALSGVLQDLIKKMTRRNPKTRLKKYRTILKLLHAAEEQYDEDGSDEDDGAAEDSGDEGSDGNGNDGAPLNEAPLPRALLERHRLENPLGAVQPLTTAVLRMQPHPMEVKSAQQRLQIARNARLAAVDNYNRTIRSSGLSSFALAGAEQQVKEAERHEADCEQNLSRLNATM